MIRLIRPSAAVQYMLDRDLDSILLNTSASIRVRKNEQEKKEKKGESVRFVSARYCLAEASLVIVHDRICHEIPLFFVYIFLYFMESKSRMTY